MSSGDEERLAASAILNKNDPGLLTYKEVKDSWGSARNFFYSYGLKPYDPDDWEEAEAISRALKAANDNEESHDNAEADKPKEDEGNKHKVHDNNNKNNGRRKT